MSTIGLALRPERYDALTVEHIPPKYWLKESALCKSKWWDYKIMHPMQATYHFVAAYKEAYKAAYGRREDTEQSRWLKVFAKEDFLEGAASTRTALWLARQKADEIGCPYSFFCSRAMHYAERRDWTMLPRPQALYSDSPMFESDKTIAQVVEAAWHEKNKIEVVYSTDDFYKIDNYVLNIHQRQHQLALLERVRTAPNKALLLSSLIFEHRLLFEEVVIQTLPGGNALVERAKDYFV